MKLYYTEKFRSDFRGLAPTISRKFYKQVSYLLKNLKHPSLHAKKYDEALNIWQARVDINYRFYFLIKDDTYILLNIRRHPK